jgi:hypothetical protein
MRRVEALLGDAPALHAPNGPGDNFPDSLKKQKSTGPYC